MKKSEQTKINLIMAGIELFSDFDYNQVSTRDLTKRAHTCLGGLFYHFCSKEKLYLEVIKYIINNSKIDPKLVYTDNFQNLPIEKMQQHITDLITLIDNEFKTNHGICFANIFQREIINKSESEAGKIINQFVAQIDESIYQTLLVYYTKINLPVNKTRFIMTTIFSILKNPVNRIDTFYQNQDKSIISNLIDLVLMQKLV